MAVVQLGLIAGRLPAAVQTMKRILSLWISSKKNIAPALFCFITSALLLVTALTAVREQRRLTGAAAEFSDGAKRLSVMQSDSGQNFCYEDLSLFLSEYNANTIHFLRSDGRAGAEMFSRGDDTWSTLMASPDHALVRKDLQEALVRDGQLYYKDAYYTFAVVYLDEPKTIHIHFFLL